jgi:hypothetical protein
MGSLTIFDGGAKQGKTTVCLNEAANCFAEISKCSVLFMSSELTERELKKRFQQYLIVDVPIKFVGAAPLSAVPFTYIDIKETILKSKDEYRYLFFDLTVASGEEIRKLSKLIHEIDMEVFITRMLSRQAALSELNGVFKSVVSLLPPTQIKSLLPPTTQIEGERYETKR